MQISIRVTSHVSIKFQNSDVILDCGVFNRYAFIVENIRVVSCHTNKHLG